MIVEYEHVIRLLEDMGLIEEERVRKIRSENTLLKLSRLPSRKTLDEFDFDFQPSIDKTLIENLSRCILCKGKKMSCF